MNSLELLLLKTENIKIVTKAKLRAACVILVLHNVLHKAYHHRNYK